MGRLTREERHAKWGGKLPPWLRTILHGIRDAAKAVPVEVYEALAGLAVNGILSAADSELKSGRLRHYKAVLRTVQLAEELGLDRDHVDAAVDRVVHDTYERLAEAGEVE